MGVVLKRYIDFLILLIPTLVSFIFCLIFVHLKKCFLFFILYVLCKHTHIQAYHELYTNTNVSLIKYMKSTKVQTLDTI